MSKVLGIKVKLDQIMNNDTVSVMGKEFVTPKKATILSSNAGTLIEAEEGGLYLIPVGDWFRSNFIGKPFPQVDAFDKLQDLGLTAIKDKLVRNDNKQKPAVKKDGQEIRSKDNVSVKKADEAVASNLESEKKD